MSGDRPQLGYAAMIEQQDRPRGILSKRDRQFLLEESYREDLAPQSQRNVRSRIRDRLRNAILDFYLLDEYLDNQDREQVFSEVDEGLEEGLHATLALLYRAADENVHTFESWFAGGLTHIELAHRSRLLIDPPSVDIDITPANSVDPTASDEKIESGNLEALTPGELRYMLWRVGKLFGGSSENGTLLGVLGEYVDRFEEQTGIAEAREMIDDTSTGK